MQNAHARPSAYKLSPNSTLIILCPTLSNHLIHSTRHSCIKALPSRTFSKICRQEWRNETRPFIVLWEFVVLDVPHVRVLLCRCGMDEQNVEEWGWIQFEGGLDCRWWENFGRQVSGLRAGRDGWVREGKEVNLMGKVQYCLLLTSAIRVMLWHMIFFYHVYCAAVGNIRGHHRPGHQPRRTE